MAGKREDYIGFWIVKGLPGKTRDIIWEVFDFCPVTMSICMIDVTDYKELKVRRSTHWIDRMGAMRLAYYYEQGRGYREVRKSEIKKPCTCGVASVGGSMHSSWCDLK